MNHGTEERQANFRTGSPSHLRSVGPQTGLSVLMSGGNLHPPQQPPTTAPTAFGTMTGSTSAKELNRSQDDYMDRDRQASALAAAGMVADSISLSRNDPDRVHSSASLHSQGLEAPPQLAGHVPPVTSSSSELDNINWNLMDLGQMHLDDMDMDFARLFDPAQEAENMQTEGSGWPTAATSSSDTSALGSLPS
jgi:hypothetical protein